MWWEAHMLTVHTLQNRGLWPPGVPVPELRSWTITEYDEVTKG